MLVKRRLQQPLHFAKRKPPISANDLPLIRNSQAKQPIALGILTRAGTKETLQKASTLRVTQSRRLAFHRRGCEL